MNYTAVTITAIAGVVFCAFVWMIADYSAKSDKTELAAREACIKSGGASLRDGSRWICVFSGRTTALKD